MTQADIRIREFTQKDAPWLIDTNVAHYAASDGFDVRFADIVRGVVEGFAAYHDPVTERGWIAEREGRPIGSIFCVEGGDLATARLKLFFLIEDARGIGLGQSLLDTCIDFAAATGRTRLILRTHESHQAAAGLYRKNGFRLIKSIPKHSFGVDVVEQHFERYLT